MIRFWSAYPLTKAMCFMYRAGFLMKGHVLVLGPIFFAIGWREPRVIPPRPREQDYETTFDFLKAQADWIEANELAARAPGEGAK